MENSEKEKVRILLIEESPENAKRTIAALHQSDLEVEVRQVSSTAGYLDELASNRPDLILSKHWGGSDCDVYAALTVAQKESIPFIFTSNLENKEDPQAVVCAFRNGATDYVLKDKLEDLVPAVKRALKIIKERRKVVPICSGCKKIRDDQNTWHQMEIFLLRNRDIRFSHTWCTECLIQFKKENGLA